MQESRDDGSEVPYDDSNTKTEDTAVVEHADHHGSEEDDDDGEGEERFERSLEESFEENDENNEDTGDDRGEEEEENEDENNLFADIELDKAEGLKILKWAVAIFSFVFCLIFVPVYTLVGTIAYVTYGSTKDYVAGKKPMPCADIGIESFELSTGNKCPGFLDGLMSVLKKRTVL